MQAPPYPGGNWRNSHNLDLIHSSYILSLRVESYSSLAQWSRNAYLYTEILSDCDLRYTFLIFIKLYVKSTSMFNCILMRDSAFRMCGYLDQRAQNIIPKQSNALKQNYTRIVESPYLSCKRAKQRLSLIVFLNSCSIDSKRIKFHSLSGYSRTERRSLQKCAQPLKIFLLSEHCEYYSKLANRKRSMELRAFASSLFFSELMMNPLLSK